MLKDVLVEKKINKFLMILKEDMREQMRRKNQEILK